MRKFKVVKELPGISLGVVLFKEDNSGALEGCDGRPTGLVLDGRRLYLAGTDSWADAASWLQEIEPEYKRWRAGFEKTYFYLDADAEVLSASEIDHFVDDDRYNIGNYFQTAGEAQAYADYLKALAVVRDDARGFKPDWSDESQEKFVVSFSGPLVEPIEVNSGFDGWAPNGVFGLPYFASYEDARASMVEHEKEWEIIFGIKDEEGE